MTIHHALQQVTTGIYIVTVAHNAEINGMVASWLSQVSLSPPQIMVAIKQGRRSHAMIEKGRVFAVHVLDTGQREMVNIFKKQVSGEQKFLSVSFELRKTGAPIITSALAYLECYLTSMTTPGDHTLFTGEVVGGEVMREGTPLLSRDLAHVYGGTTG